MAKILILIGAHVCTAPRPQKEADALSAAGHEVIVKGFWFDPKMVSRDLFLVSKKKWVFQPILDFQPIRISGRLRNFKLRLQRRFAIEAFRRLGIFLPELLGYGVSEMLKSALNTEADLTIVHSEAGLWVGNQLLNKGLRVGVDFEDWFSEDLLPGVRALRPISELKRLESRLIRECVYCLAPSNSLAEALSKAYGSPKPTVVYNIFPFSESADIDPQKKDRRNLGLPSLHWFSQTLGPGRGLELFFDSLPYLELKAEIHLRGDCSKRTYRWLDSLIPQEWREHVFIHPTVSNYELPSRIAEHDVGLALELSHIPSRNLTVTNKLFQYMQAGLAIVATDTEGQREVLSQCPGVGRLVPDNDPLALARAIEDLLSSPERLQVAKKASLKEARKNYCWEQQTIKIINTAENALKDRRCT